MERANRIGGFFFEAQDADALSAWYAEHSGSSARRPSRTRLEVWIAGPGPTEFAPFGRRISGRARTSGPTRLGESRSGSADPTHCVGRLRDPTRGSRWTPRSTQVGRSRQPARSRGQCRPAVATRIGRRPHRMRSPTRPSSSETPIQLSRPSRDTPSSCGHFVDATRTICTRSPDQMVDQRHPPERRQAPLVGSACAHRRTVTVQSTTALDGYQCRIDRLRSDAIGVSRRPPCEHGVIGRTRHHEVGPGPRRDPRSAAAVESRSPMDSGLVTSGLHAATIRTIRPACSTRAELDARTTVRSEATTDEGSVRYRWGLSAGRRLCYAGDGEAPHGPAVAEVRIVDPSDEGRSSSAWCHARRDARNHRAQDRKPWQNPIGNGMVEHA